MKRCLIRPLGLILIVIKIAITVAILISPQLLKDTAYPFMMFFPVLFSAFAYSISSKNILRTALICIVLLLCVTVLLTKKDKKKLLMRIIQIFFCIEALCYCLSLLFGSFMLGKLLGIIFNCIILGQVKSRGQGDGSPVP